MNPDSFSNERLPLALLSLRAGVTLVFAIWVLDKFVNPAHGAAVFGHFYFMSGLGLSVIQAIGIAQGLIVLGFAIGFKKRLTYGLVLAMHLVSTLASYKVYMDPWGAPNILFWAAWPMLAATFALYYLRDHDTLLTVK